MRPAASYSLRLVALGVFLSWFPCAGEPAINPNLAKIQFLHYVAQYAGWPKDVLSSHNKEFVLGVLGENTFGEALEHYFKGKSVKSRGFVIKYFKTAEEAKGACHMLFVSSSEKSNFAPIIEQLADTSILTISDSDGFIQKNGMIFMFITERSEITGGLGWDINVPAMKQARL